VAPEPVHPPLEAGGLVPLGALPELRAHEHELLAREGPHEGIERAEGGELAPVVLRDLVDHRPLAVDHLVVADGEHVVLGVVVHHRERHLVVVVLPVDRLLGDVAQRVVHPAHVPLEPEPEPAHADRLRHTAERRRLLSDHDDARHPLVQVAVDVLQEVDGLEVVVPAVDVRHPLAVLAVVVEVEHRGDGVHAQRVDVELGHPVQGVGDEEGLHLVAGVVEDVGAPLLVLALAGVRVLVEGGAVEAAECPLVLGEVPGNPVKDHADAGLVQAVHEVAELVRAAEPGHGGEVVRDLVTPRGLERVLRDRHELHVGETLPGDVLDQFVRQFEVGLAATPRAEVHLVDRHGRGVRGVGGPRGQPLVVGPGVLALVDDRGVRRRPLGEARHRVHLLVPDPVGTEDVVLVHGALADALDEQRPHPGAGNQVHVVPGPPVEVPVDPHRVGVGGPDREAGAGDLTPLVVLDRHHVRTEAFPALRVTTLVEAFEVPAGQTTGHVVCHEFSSSSDAVPGGCVLPGDGVHHSVTAVPVGDLAGSVLVERSRPAPRRPPDARAGRRPGDTCVVSRPPWAQGRTLDDPAGAVVSAGLAGCRTRAQGRTLDDPAGAVGARVAFRGPKSARRTFQRVL